MLQIYNSLTGKKEPFTPLVEGRVSMYVCGPTVYNRVHIGNARPAVVFDTLFRVLRELYAEVVYARNITDVDDKIIRAAEASGESIEVISRRYAEAYDEDMQALLNLEPTITPYATEHIGDMISMIETLISKGHAYEAEGHVLFAVQSMEDYGKLSRRSLEDMLAGARVEVAPYKKYAGDFVLWKPAEEAEPGWDSPWGRGRPGWHVECSAMIERHLGDTIDIHGGGRDLIFPHHENEKAQSQCAHDGETFVRYWLHNGYINIDGEKMSKSLGNFRMVNELLQNYPGEVLRFALLSAHYRSELNFSVDLLEQAKAALDTLYGALRSVKDIPVKQSGDYIEQPCFQALLDDLNTPIAIRELHALAKAMNKAESGEQAELKSVLVQCAAKMGLLQQDPDAWFQDAGGSGAISAEQVEMLIEERNAARREKDWAKADQVRDRLQAEGIVLDDGRDGTSWRRQS